MDKLASDAAQALAAGMSYGKWKAMQGSDTGGYKPPATQRQPVMVRVCTYCGKEFPQYDRRTRVYCCYACKRRAERKREKARIEKLTKFVVCAHCGKSFPQGDNRARIYCSEQCKWRAAHDRKKARSSAAGKEGTGWLNGK